MKAEAIQAIVLYHARVTPKTVWSFLEVRLADGTSGWGEATLTRAPHALDAPAAVARQALAGGTLLAVDRFVAAQGVTAIAQASITSALEQATWDLRARRAGRSAARLSGQPVREDIALYANMNRRTVDRSPAGFLRSARETVAAGYTTLKIAPFDDVTPENDATPEGRALIDAGLARVAAVREAAGAGVGLYVDCHWRFSAPTALGVLRELAALGVVWFECPLPETVATMGQLRRLRAEANTLGVRLAGLEELTHPEAFRIWLEAGCYDVVMPDVKYAGGIGGVLRVAEMAAQHHTSCAPHNPTGPVCHAASLVACALGPNIEMLEHQFDETPAFWSIVEGTLQPPHRGVSHLPAGPGLGVVPRRALLVD